MARKVQYAFLLLIAGMALHVCEGISQKTRCVSQPPCFDLLVLERLSQHVSKDVLAADGENILIKSQTFDKIRKQKSLHGCVLEKIIDFYENVFSYAWDNSSEHYNNYHPELISIMDKLRNCTYEMNKRCEKLNQKASQAPSLEIKLDMTPEEVAILQLQKLNYASKRLNDKGIQERAMDELKSLHNYIPGRGFRKTDDRRKS